jgi:hypothetical protein
MNIPGTFDAADRAKRQACGFENCSRGHDAMITQPDELAKLLLDLAPDTDQGAA